MLLMSISKQTYGINKRLLEEYDVGRIVFTGEDGEINTCKVKDYNSEHITHGNRYLNSIK